MVPLYICSPTYRRYPDEDDVDRLPSILDWRERNAHQIPDSRAKSSVVVTHLELNHRSPFVRRILSSPAVLLIIAEYKAAHPPNWIFYAWMVPYYWRDHLDQMKVLKAIRHKISEIWG
jgi:hypothetical protein